VIAAFTDRVGLDRYALYMFDWGAPVGFRLAESRGEAIEALIIQNGNAYKEGLSDRMLGLKAYWENREAVEPRIRAILQPEALIAQYQEGARCPEAIAPDAATLDRHCLEQPGRQAAILDLFYDYQHNVEHYDTWHAWLRDAQPRTLILWGEKDPFFTVAGARAYLGDVPDAELHLLDTGHFALQEDEATVAQHIKRFLGERRATPVGV
jgi:pimeloyl-ACP methyl ester carboxylesterase